MKTRVPRVLGFLLAFLILQVPLARSGMKKIGQAGMTWLAVDPSARSAGMGSVVDWVRGDPNGIFHNPASLADIRGTAFALNYTRWIADMRKYDATICRRLGQWGVVAISFQTIDYGEIYGTTIANNEKGYEETGVLDVGAYAAGVSFSKSLTDKFSFGVVAKYVYQRLGANDLIVNGEVVQKNKVNQVDNVAYDFGTIYDTGIKSLRVSMSFRNYSSQNSFEFEEFPLPLTYRIGLSANLLEFFPALARYATYWRIALEGVDAKDRSDHLNYGTELCVDNRLFVRLGYNYHEGGYAQEGGLALGVGFRFFQGSTQWQLDYAFTTRNSILGNVSRFTLSGNF